MATAAQFAGDPGEGAKASASRLGLKLMGGIRLIVTEGLHSGARIVLREPSFSIGGSERNDVVLLADDLAPVHAGVAVINPWLGKLRIDAQEQPIETLDGRIIDAGRYVEMTLPAEFRVGRATFRLESVKNLAKLRRIILTGLALAILLPFLPSLIQISPGPIQPSILGIPQRPPIQTIRADSPGLDTWQSLLTDRVTRSGLTGQVRIEKGPSGSLIATGSVEPQALQTWRDILKWHDIQAGAPPLVNNVTRTEAQTEMPSFRAVWVDAKPQIVLNSGQTATIGDTIPGGWRIEAIETSGVTLSREGRKVKIGF
jgi:hypothetical protein